MKLTRTGDIPKIQSVLKAFGDKKVDIGFFEEAVYPDGTPVAYVAAIHEFGYPAGGIPARSFFRPTIAAKANEWARQVAGASLAVIKGDTTADAALEGIGGMAAGQVAEAIARITSPALKEATIRARTNASGGTSSKPLVDTGQMLQSVTHKVGNL